MDCSMPDSLSITNYPSLLKLMSMESVMPPNHLILLCCPLLLLLSVFPSIRVFSNESIFLHQVAKVLEFQLRYQSFQWIFRISFRIDGLDLGWPVGSTSLHWKLNPNLWEILFSDKQICSWDFPNSVTTSTLCLGSGQQATQNFFCPMQRGLSLGVSQTIHHQPFMSPEVWLIDYKHFFFCQLIS